MKTKYLALLSILCLAAFNLQAKRVQGVTDDSIKVGMITDLSGPAAFFGREALDGMKLYIDHINDRGGVHGRKIVLLHEDDGYQPPRSIAAFRKLHDRDRVFCFAGNFGSSTVMATLPFIKRANVPLVGTTNLNSRMHTPFKKNVFPIGPSYNVQSWMMVKHIMNTWEEDTPPRIAVIYQDDDMGHDGMDGLHEAIEAYGLKLVAEESHKRGTIDFSSQVQNIKRKEATHVILWTIYRECAAILKEASQADFKPTFIGGAPACDTKVLELAGKDAEGYLALFPSNLWSNEPTQKSLEYRELVGKLSPRREIANVHSIGYSIAQLLIEGLERAGPDLTREKLVAALETLKQFETAMLTFTFGSGVRGGVHDRALMLKALPGQNRFEKASDWIIHNTNAELAKH